MDYQRIYDAFIVDRLAKFPSKSKHPHRERHHIVPKCLKGMNDPENLVSLTYSDHMFVHLLLARIHGGKLAIAFQKMTTVERYRGRHTRLAHTALMAESRRAKGDGRRGGTQSEKQRAAIKQYNESRIGKGAHPNLVAGWKRHAEWQRGKPAHPNSIIAASRSGDNRTPAQKARNEATAAKRRGQPASPAVLAGVKKGADMLRGNPWPPARRAAQDAKMAAISGA